MRESQPHHELWEAFIKGHPNEEQIKALKELSDEELDLLLKKQWDNPIKSESIFTQQEKNRILSSITSKRKKRKNALFYYAAASIALLLFVYVLLENTSKRSEKIQVNQPILIAPGGNKATLTLSNGQVIAIDEKPEGLLTTEGKSKIIKTEEGKIIYQTPHLEEELLLNTIQTPRGGQYQLVLSDGTQVWLNASSSLTYPNTFGKSKPRTVLLQGEAYFKVTENKKQPFKVRYANGIETKVIGTSFNINAYQEEKSVLTTLAEGRIQVKMPNSQLLNLQPGEQLAYTQGFSKISRVDMEAITAWKTGWFIFDRLELEVILRQMSRWYDIDFELKDDIGQKQFSGIVSRSNPISEVLKIMEGTGVKFTLMGSKIEVSR
jgi:hypothetical protein